ncbi:unnamed protein product [Orchesella dallaii]|uniref:Gustatory receptor n=1 Tax=Orchesella dallaii TaxID=48710 RepID=A0ABP1PLE0_9HEXA
MDKVKAISTTKASYSVFRRCSKNCAEKPLNPSCDKSDDEVFGQKITPEGESALLVPFFNFFYYLGLVPFKTELVRKTNRYCIRTNILQQIMCGILHVFLCVFGIHVSIACILQFKKDTHMSIIAMLEFACNLSSMICMFLMMWIVWRKRERDQYLHLIEITRCNLKHPKAVAFLVQFISLILCLIMCFIFWFMIQESSHYRSIHHLEIYGIFNHNSNASSATKDSSFNTNLTDFKFGVLFFQTLALRQIGKEFRIKLNNLNEVADIKQGILLYRKLKETSNLIRILYGNQILAFYISSVAYYAETPYILLGNRGDSERGVVIYFLINGLNWLVAAEFHYNTFNSVLHWISIHTDDDGLNCDMKFRLLSISNEMSANPIALSCRCFAVTYQHLGSVRNTSISD